MKQTVYILIGLSLMTLGLSAYKVYDQPEYETLTISDGDFKNLKILPQDISKDSLESLMKEYTVALGVKCNFCHESKAGKLDFVSDAKHEKEVARHMIKFTNELNKNEFAPIGKEYEQAITCATCHRGGKHPMKDVEAFHKKQAKK